ncbi:MAG: hypothetical protein IT305_19435 [Chloroflexi bacterium]|nr:hypothetical protein [Chloroflexota bacterium]
MPAEPGIPPAGSDVPGRSPHDSSAGSPETARPIDVAASGGRPAGRAGGAEFAGVLGGTPSPSTGGATAGSAAESGTADAETATDLGKVDYLVVGHVSVDVFNKRLLLGGSATYSALTAQRLGQRVGVLTSADFEPLLMDTLVGREQFRQAATPIRIIRVPTQSTTTFVNLYEDGVRHQVVLGAAAPLRADQIPQEWTSAPIVHLAPLVQEVDPSIVDRVRGGLIGVTPQGWMRVWAAEGDRQGHVRAVPWDCAEAILARADVVVLSPEDLADPSLLDHYIALARLLIVTESRRGAVVYERGQQPWRSLAFKPAREIDPTGAGDVFATAFFVEYGRTGDPRRSADFANCTASFVLEKRAWQGIPSSEAVAERLARGKRRGA